MPCRRALACLSFVLLSLGHGFWRLWLEDVSDAEEYDDFVQQSLVLRVRVHPSQEAFLQEQRQAPRRVPR